MEKFKRFALGLAVFLAVAFITLAVLVEVIPDSESALSALVGLLVPTVAGVAAARAAVNRTLPRSEEGRARRRRPEWLQRLNTRITTPPGQLGAQIEVDCENRQRPEWFQRWSERVNTPPERKPYRCKLEHTGGLPLPAGVACRVYCDDFQAVFSASGQDFTLSTNALLDVSIMTATDIQRQYVSSIGGAIAGGMLLGPLGAALGGSASVRKIKTTSRFLVFAYASEDGTKYFIFDVTKRLSAGRTIVRKYACLKKRGNVRVDL